MFLNSLFVHPYSVWHEKPGIVLPVTRMMGNLIGSLEALFGASGEENGHIVTEKHV